MQKFVGTTLAAAIVYLVIITSPLASEAKNTNQYDAEYFAQYAPSTALDMVSRLPGFSLSSADNKRGLGQGGANVLINGERATGKTGAGSQLGRISASNVVRIEILDGASLDIPGLSGQVANIVTKTSGITGTWSWAPEVRRRQSISLGHVHATVSGELGNWSYSAEARQEQFHRGGWGIENLTEADGTLFETRDEDHRFYGETPGLIVDFSWKPGEQRVGNINLEYNKYNFTRREISARQAITDAGNTIDTEFSFAEDETNGSVGADYEFPLGMGKLKAIGYYRFEESPTKAIFDVFESQDLTDASRFSQQADESESILRSEYSWTPSAGRDWQVGLEGAFNILDITAQLETLAADGSFIQASLEGATSRVEERRAEITATHTRTLSPQWDLQFSLGTEYSELSQTGGLQREFTRPKGFIASTYKPDDTLSIRTKIEHEVGQLNFFDFISSINLNDNQSSTGNVNLVPSQSWVGELEFDKDFGDGNSLNVKFYGSEISDLVDRVPVGINGDAVGNIDTAYQYGVDSNMTIQGGRWGWPGTELKIGLDYRKSEVDDPLTGISRRLNSDKISFYEIEFRHDIADTFWAYGFSTNQDKQAPIYRINTKNQYQFDGPWGLAFVEHKNFFGMKINASLRNLFDAKDVFTRELYTDRRDIGVLDSTESLQRKFDVFFLLEVSGTF